MQCYPSELLDRVNDAIIVLDRDWKLTYLNLAAARELRIAAGELPEPNLWEIAPPFSGTVWKEKFRQALEHQRHESFEALSPLSGRCFEVRVFPFAAGLVVYAQDVTDRKRIEEELRESEHRYHQIEYSMREREQKLQELNETLEERVAERTALAEKQAVELRQLIDELGQAEHRERAHLARVLHDHLQQLLVAAKFRIRTLHDSSSPVDLRNRAQQLEALIGRAIEESRSLAFDLSPPVLTDVGLVAGLDWLGRRLEEKHGLRVKFRTGEGCEPGDDDLKRLLFQSARELLLNVAKHANVSEAELELRRDEAGNLNLTVSDRGRGLDLTRLTERVASSGFGLFTMQQRIEILGGRFEIRSSPTQGCSVAISVPVKGVNRVVPTMESHSQVSGFLVRPATEGGAARTSVLIVDDHEILREGIVSLLESIADIEVIGQAGDGATAVEMTRNLRPDVVLMDITMPIMNGVEATRFIKSEMPDCHVIALSMHEKRDMAEAMREAGASAYISKDAPWDELSSVIRKVVSPEAGGR
jgi:PAS domain S-box-containing protein